MTPQVARALAAPPVARTSTEIVVATSGEELASLAPQWDALATACHAPDPFLTHEWLATWWQCFGGDAALRVLVARDGEGRVRALLPLAAERRRSYGVTFDCLSSTWNPHTPRLDLLVADADAEAVCAAVWEHLERAAGDWDVLELPQLPAASPLFSHLAPLAARRGFRIDTREGSRSPFVTLAGRWGDFLESRSPKHRDNLRRVTRRLASRGELSLEVIEGGPALETALDEGFRIEAAAWKGEAGTAITSRPEVESFYRTLARRAAERGWLELHFLRLGDRRIAFEFALRYRETIFSLKVGYDPEFARWSPGIVLIGKALESAFARGLARYDLLGESERWKRAWTDEARDHRWLFAFRPAARARLLHLMKFRLAPHLRGDGRADDQPSDPGRDDGSQ